MRSNLTLSFISFRPLELMYLQFALKITEDIIRNDFFAKPDMIKIFKGHIEENLDHLDFVSLYIYLL